MMRIVLIESRELDAHRLRSDSRRAGFCMLYDCAGGRGELERLLSRGASAIVAGMAGEGDLAAATLTATAEQAGVPLVLVGGDTEQERVLLGELRGRYAASLRMSRVTWLPVLLDRTVRELGRDGATTQREVPGAAALDDAEDLSGSMRQLQKLALIGRLSVSIAHEINNPLEAVTNLTYLMSLDDQMPAHLRPYLEMAEQELARVGQITKQSLTFNRETRDAVAILPSELMEEVLTLYARKLADREIRVERKYESEDPLMLFPGEMRQVYANLIANAIDAMGTNGRIVVRIRKARRRRPGQEEWTEGVRVTVADSGSGIRQSVRAKLGQPFYTTKGQTGTGLGLWVSQGIVKRHQGYMHLRSSTAPESHGTTFSIFLPRTKKPRVIEMTSFGKAEATEGARSEGVRLRASSQQGRTG